VIHSAKSILTVKEVTQRERQASQGVAPSRGVGRWRAAFRPIGHFCFCFFIVFSGMKGEWGVYVPPSPYKKVVIYLL